MQLIPQHAMNRAVSHNPGVRAAVDAKAQELAGKARANLAAHRETGNSSVDVELDGVDALVVLSDPRGNALAIEYGHAVVDRHGNRVGYAEGLYILSSLL